MGGGSVSVVVPSNANEEIAAPLFSRIWWIGPHGALPRAIRTFAQAAVSMLAVGTFSDWSARWHEIVATAGVAAVLSLMMSLDAPTHHTRGKIDIYGTPDDPTDDVDAPEPQSYEPVPQQQYIPPDGYQGRHSATPGCGTDLRG